VDGDALEELRVRATDRLRHDARESPRLFVRVPARDRDVDVQARPARRPREAREPEELERVAQHASGGHGIAEPATALRVEVEEDVVGPGRPVAARRPHVQAYADG